MKTMQADNKSKRVGSVATALCASLVFCLSGQAIAMEEASTEQASNSMPEQVNIVGRKYFRVLEAEIRDAEDHMFALYNEVNKDNMYDVSCAWETELGTRIPQRICRPTFVQKASEQEAQAYNLYVTHIGGNLHSIGVDAPSVQSSLGYHYPILREKMEEALTENKEFLDAVIHHYKLRENLKERKSSFFGVETSS